MSNKGGRTAREGIRVAGKPRASPTAIAGTGLCFRPVSGLVNKGVPGIIPFPHVCRAVVTDDLQLTYRCGGSAGLAGYKRRHQLPVRRRPLRLRYLKRLADYSFVLMMSSKRAIAGMRIITL